MKELVTLLARLAFLALVIGCVVVTYLVMTGEKWQSPKPKPKQKKTASQNSFDPELGRQARSTADDLGPRS